MENISISVSDPNIKTKSMRKHVQYLVKGCDSSGPFEQFRRYKEFLHLRGILQKEWPGCFIPKLPPKKFAGNFNPNFVERRRKLLGLFLSKACSYPFIYNGESFQRFLRWEEDYLKVEGPKTYNINKIYENYLQVFSEYATKEISDLEFIRNEKALFENTLENLRIFKERCEMSALAYSKYSNALDVMHPLLSEILSVQSQELNIASNPFNILFDWVIAEELDILAILETINQQKELEKLLQSKIQKKEEESSNLENLKTGKKKIFGFLSKKSPEQKTNDFKSKISELENDIEMLSSIINIVNARLVYREIELIKERVVRKFEKAVRSYTTISTQEFEYYQNYILALKNYRFFYTFDYFYSLVH